MRIVTRTTTTTTTRRQSHHWPSLTTLLLVWLSSTATTILAPNKYYQCQVFMKVDALSWRSTGLLQSRSISRNARAGGFLFRMPHDPDDTRLQTRSSKSSTRISSSRRDEESIPNDFTETVSYSFETHQTMFVMKNHNQTMTVVSTLPNQKKQQRRPWRRSKKQQITLDPSPEASSPQLQFLYDYYQLEIDNGTQTTTSSTTASTPTTTTTTMGVVLLHPIGVGIAKWYNHRLLHSLKEATTTVTTTANNNNNNGQRFVIVAPDLLGCGSACQPTIVTTTTTTSATTTTVRSNTTMPEQVTQICTTLPLMNISDWTDQIVHLMADVEHKRQDSRSSTIERWCIVANGGMAPIALQVGQRWVEKVVDNNNNNNDDANDRSATTTTTTTTTDTSPTAPFFVAPVTNIILSSVPRLPFFVTTTTPPDKVARSYRTLCGIPGRLFWWYACRRDGKFIQTFSETNLVADASRLGPDWTPNCVTTARMERGMNRFATFAFLAGTLQDGCQASLDALRMNRKINAHTDNKKKNGTTVQIDIIKGRDIRRNQAKSWFWQTPKKNKQKQQQQQPTTQTESTKLPDETIREYVERNGNGGRELVIGGRISLAHEDAPGYANALLEFLQ
jgi:hypothetical protein